MKKIATPAPVVALLRYAHKRDNKPTGGITYIVKASDWTPQNQHCYDVTVFRGKATSCTCLARGGSCKHRLHCEQLEQRRREHAPLNGNKPFDLLRRAS